MGESAESCAFFCYNGTSKRGDKMIEEKSYTPMMTHYLELKKANEDSIIFYRLGDFYEMFFEDAKKVSAELDLVLTRRSAGNNEKVPMCGVPHHAANNYIQRLIQRGYKVAIVEQLEEASAAKGIVKRDIVKIVTPGTIMEESGNEKVSVYIASMVASQDMLAIALCEMSSGEVEVQCVENELAAVQKAILGNHVKEVVVEKSFDKKLLAMLHDQYHVAISYVKDQDGKAGDNHLVKGVEDTRMVKACGLLFTYLDETQRQRVQHLQKVRVLKETAFLQMDYHSKCNLELTQSQRENQKTSTLWNFLDRCQSAMGSRMLAKWIDYPLRDKAMIHDRLDTIAFLHENFLKKEDLKTLLANVYDIERINARIAYGSASPRDLLRLEKTLAIAPKIIEIFKSANCSQDVVKMDPCTELYQLLQGVIDPDAPLQVREGGVFAKGYLAQLDELLEIKKNGKQWILDLEVQERERTGIKSLKIGYNRVFGYYIEVSNANKAQIQQAFGYVRKQTLRNAERYITEDLKQKEAAILHAQEQCIALEVQCFLELCGRIKGYMTQLYALAKCLAGVDALYALALVSEGERYTRPVFDQAHAIHIEEGRHPILDQQMHKQFVGNDVHMKEDCDVLMITGPNMGGKSTYMRQCALLVIMAQMGCYVPAKRAHLPIFDQIFTRMGASDDIMSGQSTFMVEMSEANQALRHASSDSLILFDELGRGTSTYDGMALAQAMMEYIVKFIGAKTLFSTHYHELTSLASAFKQIRNVHVEVKEAADNIIFLYRVVEGKADKSYGIHVAKLAQLPSDVLKRATFILEHLEDQEQPSRVEEMQTIQEAENMKVRKILKTLKKIDVNRMTPIAAMQCLADLKNQQEEE